MITELMHNPNMGEILEIAQTDPDGRVSVSDFNDATFGAASLDQLAEREDDELAEDIVSRGGFADRSTPVDTLMAAPCGLGLEVAEHMEGHFLI